MTGRDEEKRRDWLRAEAWRKIRYEGSHVKVFRLQDGTLALAMGHENRLLALCDYRNADDVGEAVLAALREMEWIRKEREDGTRRGLVQGTIESSRTLDDLGL